MIRNCTVVDDAVNKTMNPDVADPTRADSPISSMIGPITVPAAIPRAPAHTQPLSVNTQEQHR